MARYKDIFGGLFWLVVAVGMYYASFSIRVLAIGGGSTSFVGSGFMPRLVAIGMAILSLTIMWQSWQKIKSAQRPEGVDLNFLRAVVSSGRVKNIRPLPGPSRPI